MSAQNEKPIIFSTAMIRANREGRKTMTRRLRGLEVINESPDDWQLLQNSSLEAGYYLFERTNTLDMKIIKCPWGQVGNFIWTREAFAEWQGTIECVKNGDLSVEEALEYMVYKATAEDWAGILRDSKKGHPWNIKPSIFMPRWASRDRYPITEIRAERLQDISFSDARAEGILSFDRDNPDTTNGGMGYNRGKAGLPMRYESTAAFMDLWDSINAKRGYPWSGNWWLWVISYKV